MVLKFVKSLADSANFYTLLYLFLKSSVYQNVSHFKCLKRSILAQCCTFWYTTYFYHYFEQSRLATGYYQSVGRYFSPIGVKSLVMMADECCNLILKSKLIIKCVYCDDFWRMHTLWMGLL
jgi:hypothetical protein